jgi:hypothetical protein
MAGGSIPAIGSAFYRADVEKQRTKGLAPRLTLWRVNLTQSLRNWAGLQGIGKKPRTQKYHHEIIKLILDRWLGPLEHFLFR